MADITVTTIESGADGADKSSFTTASYTPNANRLILACLYINETTGGGTPPVPTLSGNGLTWTLVATSTTGTVRACIFRAVGSAPSIGALTIDFAGNTENDLQWIIEEFTDINIGGTNGANAIVQSATNTASNPSSLTVTLGAFSNAINPTFGLVCSRNGPGPLTTPGDGFTEITEVGSIHMTQTQWKKTNDTSVDWSFSSPLNDACAIALELKNNQTFQGAMI